MTNLCTIHVMAITHHVVQFDRPVIDELKSKGVINKSTYFALKAAEVNGGFVAGGFAAQLARLIVQRGHIRSWVEPHIDDCYDALLNINSTLVSRSPGLELLDYLGLGLDKKNYHDARAWWKVGNGDIDVWFPSDEAIENFQSALKSYTSGMTTIVSSPTPGGFGTEYVCFQSDGTRGQLIQAITKYTGTPAEVVDTFDIYNAACYFKDAQLFIPDGWEWLLEQKQVHVHKWRENYALQRLAKYVQKHGYDGGLTPASLIMINDKIEYLLDQVGKGIITFEADFTAQDPEALPGEKQINFIFKFLHPLMKNLTPENLALLSIHYPASAYNFAMKELVRWTEATLQQHP